MYPRKFPLIFSFCLFISLMAGNFYAYTQGKDARVTISCENLTISDFFNAIWEQTQLQAFFNDQQINNSERISVTFKNEPLDNVLAYLLRKRDLTWDYRGQVFVILPWKEGDPLLGEMPKNVTRTVTGTVRDNNGIPVKNIFVGVRSSFKGTRTDENGQFRLKDVKPDARLATRSILYINKEVIAKEDTINIQVDPYIANLDQITVVGYPQRTLTGNISKVKEEDITAQPVSNPLFALQGRVPGLNISAISGLPGSSLNIRLRGRNSIDCSTDPLIIYDGLPFFSGPSNSDAANLIGSGIGLGANIAASPLNLINVHDIASMSVLKDADATAIYGTRGANGVIVITSKTPGEDKKGMTVNVYSGIAEVSHLVKYLDLQQYLQMRHEGLSNDNRSIDDRDYDLKVWDTTRYTNWPKMLIGGTGHVTNANMEVVGGGKTSSYRLSSLYRRESTVYPGKDFLYTKGSLRFQYNFSSLNKKFNTAVSANYVTDRNKLPSQDLIQFSSLPPNTPEPYVNDKINFAGGTFFNNPYSYMLRTYKAVSHNARINSTSSYQLTPGLSIISTLGYGSFTIHEIQANPSRSYAGQLPGFSNFADTKFSNLIAELQGLWKKTIGKEQFNMLIGTTFQKDGKTTSNYTANGYKDDTQLENKKAATTVDTFNLTRPNYRYISYYARIGYKHNDKYLLNITINRDGSTRLSPVGKYGNFGTIAAGWIFSRESWLIQNRFLSFGKLRGSLGITGNDRWAANENQNSYLPFAAAEENISIVLPYKNYTWEKVRKAEAGLDLGLFNDQLLVNFSLYHNRSTNLLLTSKPPFNGGKKDPVNYPAVVENKGMEVEIISNNIRSDKLTWTTNFNISFPSTELKAFPFLEMTSYKRYYSVGLPLDMVNRFHVSGVDPQEGIFLFVDKNGNRVTADALTPDDYVYGKGIGATLYGGIQNNIRWKGLEIEFLLRFVRQNNYGWEYANSNVAPGAIRNQPATVFDLWQHPGDVARIQRFTSLISTSGGTAFRYLVESDHRIINASYIKMQSLSVAWYLPEAWLQRIRIKSSKLFVQGQNLFTITGYPGLDPETAADVEIYPTTRMVTAGLQIAF